MMNRIEEADATWEGGPRLDNKRRGLLKRADRGDLHAIYKLRKAKYHRRAQFYAAYGFYRIKGGMCIESLPTAPLPSN
jgi:hypothetical protein